MQLHSIGVRCFHPDLVLNITADCKLCHYVLQTYLYFDYYFWNSLVSTHLNMKISEQTCLTCVIHFGRDWVSIHFCHCYCFQEVQCWTALFCDINVALINADINNAVMSRVAPPYLKAHFHEWKTLATKELKATIQLKFCIPTHECFICIFSPLIMLLFIHLCFMWTSVLRSWQ